MVFYFKARPEAGDYTIFMGLDKFENEELIKYGFPEDVWFHVDKMSSAHVYVRLHKGQTLDDISPGLLEDCVQLVKANSIQGNKVNNVDVVYTPWANLKKTASMDVGQVGFHNSKMVRTVRVEKRINEIVNRLNKTKVERKPDLKAEREAVNAAERAERKLQLRDKEECRKRLIEKYGENGPFPDIDEDNYKDVLGLPMRGRWVGVPPQLSQPELFEQPRPSQREIDLKEQHRKDMDEISDLRCRIATLEDQVANVQTKVNARVEALVKAQVEARMNELARSTEAAINSMWLALRKGGHVRLSDVPATLVAGPSQPSPLIAPRQEHPPRPPSFDLTLTSTQLDYQPVLPRTSE